MVLYRGPSGGEVAQQVAGIISGGAGAYQQQQELQSAKDVANDPNATPMQKAIAVSKINPKLAPQVLKEQRMSQLGAFLSSGDARAPVGAPPGAAPTGIPRAGVGVEDVSVSAEEEVVPEEGAGLEQVPTEKLERAAIEFPEYAQAINPILTRRQADEKNQQQLFIADRKFATEQNKPYVTRIEQIKDSMPRKEQALNLARTAIESGDLGAFSRNNLAKIFGRPELETASGAQLNLAVKENLIANLSRVSGRAQNKWLEQVAIGAFPQAGKSESANQIVQTALEAESALDRAESEISDALSEKEFAEVGYLKAGFRNRVQSQLKPIEDGIMRRASYRSRQIVEQEKGPKELSNMAQRKVPPGTPLTQQMFREFTRQTKDAVKALERAKNLGYTVYSIEEIKEYE